MTVLRQTKKNAACAMQAAFCSLLGREPDYAIGRLIAMTQ
jgi:hypothetical protein